MIPLLAAATMYSRADVVIIVSGLCAAITALAAVIVWLGRRMFTTAEAQAANTVANTNATEAQNEAIKELRNEVREALRALRKQ